MSPVAVLEDFNVRAVLDFTGQTVPLVRYLIAVCWWISFSTFFVLDS
jgi:hypothetical protein